MLNKLFSFFKKRDPEFMNCLHRDFVNKTEKAFRAGGVQYYRMMEEVDMPYGRYKEVSAFLYEVELRMTKKTLQAYVEQIKSFLSGSRGEVDLGKVWKILYAMDSRLELQFEPETARRLATVVYFDESESLISYDPDHAQKKLKIWDKEGSYDFFLTRPMAELLGLNGISPQVLVDYITQTQELLKELNLEPPKAS